MVPRAILQGSNSLAFTLIFMLKLHKDAMAQIKSSQQRVRKAAEECEKLREKLKKAQARLAVEKDRLKKSQENLES
jgi:hypothetical protein